MKYGKHAARHDVRTLKFSSYLGAGLPKPYAQLDNFARMAATLGVDDPASILPMDGNDEFGCCTIAALYHAITLFRGLIGKGSVGSVGDVVALYLMLTGGADSGLPELDVLKYWRNNRVDDDQILAFVSIDPKDHEHVKLAMMLFGGVYLGFQVQEACQLDFEAKRLWTPGPLVPDEGHAVLAGAYDGDDSVKVSTWGGFAQGGWPWWDACVDECYAILPPEALEPGFAPGFNGSQLRVDLLQL